MEGRGGLGERDDVRHALHFPGESSGESSGSAGGATENSFRCETGEVTAETVDWGSK